MPNLGTVNTTTSIATSAELTTAEGAAATALATHDADTTAVHGVANTANLYVAGGTDVAVADGGTGASTAAGARTNLGLGTAALAATGDFDVAGAADAVASDFEAADAAHAGAADPHTGYLKESEVSGFATPAVVLGTAAAAGAATTAVRSDATLLAFDATAPVTQAYSDAAATGAATVAARRDHKHGMPAAGAGAPADATYLTSAAHAGLSAEVVVTTAGLALLDDNAASDQRTTLGLVIGTDVQAFDADIPTVAASQAEMEAGTEAAIRSMSPLRVAQGIAALAGGDGGAPADAAYLVTTASAGLSAEVVVPAAVLTVLDDTTVAAMVDTLGGASSTGTGGLVRATSPSLVTPALGTPASGVATNLTGTAAGLTAGNVTTNANLTGRITSVGNATNVSGLYLPYRTGGGQYYGTWTGAVSGLVLVLNTMYCAPFFVPVTTTFTKIAVVATAVASSSARLGIYSDTAGVPDALVLDAGTVATTASAIATITISQQLTPGWYWLTAAIQGAASNLYCNNSGFFANANLPASAPGFSMISGGYSVTGISGALPSPWGATKTESARCPVIWLAPA